jgi:hypothetical protein
VLGTKQAAISRHESGVGNICAKTVEAILKALDAICRIDLIPAERESFRTSFPRWWTAMEEERLSEAASLTLDARIPEAPRVWGQILTAVSSEWSAHVLAATKPKLASGDPK